MACVPKAGSPTRDHYVFLDANQKELASTEQDTTYDPRVRPWYRAAEQRARPSSPIPTSLPRSP